MKSLSANEPKNLSIVVGDKITVRRNGVNVKIRVEYVGEEHVEGSVLKSKGNLRAGRYVAVQRSEVQRNTQFIARVTQTQLD